MSSFQSSPVFACLCANDRFHRRVRFQLSRIDSHRGARNQAILSRTTRFFNRLLDLSNGQNSAKSQQDDWVPHAAWASEELNRQDRLS